MRVVLVAVFLLLAVRAARADEVAYSCDAAPNVKPLTDRGACVGFIAHDAQGREVNRVDRGYFVSGMLLASADGRSVMMLQSAPEATGKLDTKDALIVFRDGKQVARYSMLELIVRMQLVTRSISHYQWLARDAIPQLALGKTLDLTTTSQRTYRFDVVTGKQLSADDTAAWKSCDLLVYLADKVAPPTSGFYSVARPWVAKGTPSFASGLAFRAARGVTVGSGVTLCLEPSTPGWLATQNVDVMYNLLPR